MQINIEKLTKAKAAAKAEARKRERLLKCAVELENLYGIQTSRDVIKFKRGTKVKGLPIRKTPKKVEVKAYHDALLEELAEQTNEAVADMHEELKGMSNEELREMIDNKADVRLMHRYGSRTKLGDKLRREFVLKPEDEREVELKMSKKDVSNWKRRSTVKPQAKVTIRKRRRKKGKVTPGQILAAYVTAVKAIPCSEKAEKLTTEL